MSRDRFRLSFGSVAEAYELSRPAYAPDAIAWIAERLPLRRVLDLAAGTGKLTRQLVDAGADVVAVEPDGEMRAVFARVLPGIELRAGAAESIPVPDASVDAVTVGQAFHWFRTNVALAEMYRVLRPGGGFALLWNVWDDDDPLMRALNDIVEALRPEGSYDAGRRREIERSPLFRNVRRRGFRNGDELPAEAAVARVASVSALAAAAPDERERALDRVRALVGAGPVRFPMVTRVVVADRA